MKIRLLRVLRIGRLDYSKGLVIDFPRGIAAALVRAGVAERAEPERAVISEVEKRCYSN